ncbi:membrane protein insertase YidC [Corynebacterium tapiri]|uniref:Membrane protein insertase YidC n=1 Tax=Corynebacterium tapiri TaxID=1448266 RepID=A0A5C4U385_9CORY|nr:membrane protein insertase YidC [Corynebacterium tapiri]TNL94638.1 membrane protein insertase YidC [Corynebacterium tapiri]
MLELFAYPVSAVMKLWHVVVSALGFGSSASWLISVVGLLVTVRLLLLPISWRQRQNAHASTLMRPEKAELQQRLGSSSDPEDAREYLKAEKELHQRYNYGIAAGCLPPLIQIPVLLGLYRLLLWMSQPAALAQHRGPFGGVGVLSARDVQEFMDAHVRGVPLQTYLAMSDAQLDALSISRQQANGVVMPLLITACVLTTLSLIVSVYYVYRYMDYHSAVTRGTARFMLVLIFFVPFMLFSAGSTGPIPLALILYWIGSNLWTLVQTVAMYTILEFQYPEDERHHAHRRAGKDLLKARKAEKKARKAEDKAFVRSARSQGVSLSDARAQLKQRQKDRIAADAQQRAEDKERKKAANKARSTARSELMKERAAERRELRAQQGTPPKKQKGGRHRKR